MDGPAELVARPNIVREQNAVPSGIVDRRTYFYRDASAI
jgi:hypothetical protein